MSNSSPEVQGFAFYGDGHETAKQTVKVIRTGLIIGAILSALFGVLILTATGQVLEVVAVLFGIYFLVRGAIRLGTGLFSGVYSAGGRVLSILIGLLLIVVGVLAVLHPVEILAVIGILIGISWIVDGVVSIVESSKSPSKTFSVIAGIISVVAGIVVVLLPVKGVAVLTLIAGVFLLIIAVAQLIGAIMIGRAAKNVS
jgi:uncharacterized membrane protein HdeD (DUF308 family)